MLDMLEMLEKNFSSKVYISRPGETQIDFRRGFGAVIFEPNLNGLKRFLDDHYGLASYTCRLPRSGLGPGVDVGLTEFGGAGCSTRVSAYRRA